MYYINTVVACCLTTAGDERGDRRSGLPAVAGYLVAG
jgi:hypothetical protein